MGDLVTPLHRPITDQAVEIIPADGTLSPAWRTARQGRVSASEIAVLLGLSPWSSPFDLYWAKRDGDRLNGDGNADTRRGRRLEALVLDDFGDERPELALNRRVGLVQNVDRPWQVCTPDALAYETEFAGNLEEGKRGILTERIPVAAVEAKTSARADGWGAAGTDEIPPYYLAQVRWQLSTLGLPAAFVPVWIGYDYRCYEVANDQADAEFMHEKALDFLDALNNDRPPPIDGHTATTARLKALHPTVEERTVELPAALVRQYQTARRLRDAAVSRVRLHENRIRDLMGTAQRGVVDGRKAASRSVYDVDARTQKVSAYTVDKLTVTQPTTKKKGSIR